MTHPNQDNQRPSLRPGEGSDFHVNENTLFVGDINAHDDRDSEGNGLTYSIAGGIDAHQFKIDSETGELSFRNAPDFEHPGDADGDNRYHVKVKVTDSLGASDTDSYNIIVKDQADSNNAPDAVADHATTTANSPVSIEVLNNDTDPDGDALSVVEIMGSGTVNGTVQIIDNQVLYTPNEGFVGNDTFAYRISDGNGGTDIAQVTIKVEEPAQPVNNEPVAVDDTISTTEGQKVGVRVLNNDSDPDGDTVTLKSFTQAANGKVVRNNNGTPGDQSDDRLVYTPNEGFTGTDTFTYTIADGNGGHDTATVSVNVDGKVDNAAPVAVDDTASTTEGQKVGVRVLNNDSDPDGDTVTLKSFTQAANGKVVRNNNGTPGDQSDDRLVYTPNDGFTGTDTFTYTVADGNGGHDTATVTVNVGGSSGGGGNPGGSDNNAPVAVDDSGSTTEGQKVGVRVLNNDTDPDGDTVTLKSFTQAANGKVVRNNNGTPGDQSDDRLVYTPNDGFTGEDTFTYTIADGNGGHDTATVTVNVNGANTAPIAVDDMASTTEGTKVGVRVLNNDTDPDGDTLQLKSFTQAANGRVVRNNNATPGDQSDDRLVYTPNEGFSGTDTFTYTIADGNGGHDTATVTVDVEKLVVEVPETGVIGGQVWHDRDFKLDGDVVNDGIQDLSDPKEAGGFKGVTVNLYTGGGELVDTTVSGTAGFYHFNDVTAGSYYVEFDASTNLVVKQYLDGTNQFSGVPGERGWTFTSPANAGNDEARDSDVTSGTSTQVPQQTDIFELQAGEVNKDVGAAITPIAFDLNGDGVQTISIDQGVQFDMLVEGYKVSTGWLSGEDAFLAIDNNQNGQIDDLSEMFGGANVGDGFAKLETFDSNNDGLVNELDENFSELLVWQDANENGITDAGELVALETAGITNMATDYTDVFSTDAAGNIHGEHSSAQLNGNTIDMVDVYFQVEV